VSRVVARLLAIALTLVAALSQFTPAQAQQADWRERPTRNFALLYIPGEEAEVERYAAFVDSIYDEVAAVFAHRTATPVTLRLYPTMELYYQANPQARNVAGVVAHANSGRREISVAVPQTERQTPDEVENNIRHELAHLVIADLSDERLNAFFHEGIAQYVEHPSRELDSKVQLLQEARDAGRLLRWRDFDDRNAVYGQPQLSYPQSLSVVAFLVERFGFGSLRAFLETYARSSGYRSALERTYNVSPDTLEAEWRDWLPSYLAGGYRNNALTAYDLSHIESLLSKGRYEEATNELNDAIEWLRKTEQSTVLAEAEQLLDRSRDGQRAQQAALDARAALEAADYVRAQQLVAQARSSYGLLGDTRQAEILAAYNERAERGLAAVERLEQAGQLASSWRYPQARGAVDEALVEFQALGDASRVTQAQTLRQLLDGRQQLLGYLLLVLGLLGVVGSLWQRVGRQHGEIW
jgi:hypothetical protein